jgi:DNA-binding MarR family transcriptional regulator
VKNDFGSYIQRYHVASDLFRQKVLSELDQLIGQLDIGVTRSQYYLLSAIQEKEPCSISSLAKKNGCYPQCYYGDA